MSEQHKRLRASLRDGRPDWFRISNAAADVAEVYIYDEIGFWGVTAQDFVAQLREVTAPTIHLHLNSPGGDVFDGIAILNALRSHKARVQVTVDGLAASAASFIAMAGDEIVMARNSEMMIHDAFGLCVGNASDMRTLADRLDGVSDNIASIYTERAGGTVTTWRDAMRAETWYTAQEAVDAGLADSVTPAKSEDVTAAKARFDLSVFNFAGRAAAPTPSTPQAPDTPRVGSITTSTQEGSPAVAFTDEQLTTLRQQVGVPEGADEATILDALTEALAERAEPAPQSTPPAIPEGHVVVPEARLADLEVAARAGVGVAERMRVQDREAFLDSVRTKFAPANRAAWATEYDRDPEGTRKHFEAAPVIVPLASVGYDNVPADDVDAADAPFMAHLAAQFGISGEALNV